MKLNWLGSLVFTFWMVLPVLGQNLEPYEAPEISLKAAQLPVNIDEVSGYYRAWLSGAISLSAFQQKISFLQEKHIWDLPAMSFLKDLYKKERKSFPEFNVGYCKVIFLFKEEFYNDYAGTFEQCRFEKVELAGSVKFSEVKVDGYLFRNEDFVNREWIDANYLFQTLSHDGDVTSEIGPPSKLNEMRRVSGAAKQVSEERIFESMMMKDEPVAKKSFYREHKTWIWIGTFLATGFFVQQNYNVEF